jgi:hypothetical protein
MYGSGDVSSRQTSQQHCEEHDDDRGRHDAEQDTGTGMSYRRISLRHTRSRALAEYLRHGSDCLR